MGNTLKKRGIKYKINCKEYVAKLPVPLTIAVYDILIARIGFIQENKLL